MKIGKFCIWAAFIILLSIGCKSKQLVQHLADADVDYIQLDDSQNNNASIEDFIGPYRKQVQEELDGVIGSVSEELRKSKPNSNMGNWFCDLLEDSAKEIFKETGVDFAVQNYGGVRLGSIPAGEITKRKIFELMPFDNTLVNVEMDKETMQKFLDRIADYGGWPISRSLKFSIQDSAAVDIMINNQPLEDKNYYVAMPDYIANGGDDCYFLKDSKKEDSGLYIRSVVIEYLEMLQAKEISAEIDSGERIKMKE